MNAAHCYSYEDIQTLYQQDEEWRWKALHQFRQLERTVRRVFRVSRCKVRLPLVGTLVLRACFIRREQVPAHSLVERMARDFLSNLPDKFTVFIGYNWSMPDEELEYYFEVLLQSPTYYPN